MFCHVMNCICKLYPGAGFVGQRETSHQKDKEEKQDLQLRGDCAAPSKRFLTWIAIHSQNVHDMFIR